MSSSLLLLVGAVTVISLVYLDGGFNNVLGKLRNILTFSEQTKKNEYNELRSGDSSADKPVDNFSTIRIDDQHVIEESFLQQRKLAADDFSAVNDLLSPSTILLEDFSDSKNFRYGPEWFPVVMEAKVSAKNIECTNLYLGDLKMGYDIKDDETLSYSIEVPEFSFECEMQYTWSWSVLQGSGKLDVDSGKSSGSTNVVIGSDDSSKRMLPHDLKTNGCSADVKLDNLVFSGSIDSIVLSFFEEAIEEVLVEQINILVCQELATMGEGLADALFTLIDESVAPHLEPVDPWRLDPLHSEQQLNVPDDVQLVNFNDTSASGTVKFFSDALDLMNNHFETTDPNDSKMGINTIIRDYVLDDDNAFVIGIEDLPFDFDPVLFNAKDSLTESRATFQKARFLGLDSLTSFVPSTALGNHTFQADVGWEDVTAEISVMLEMKTATESTMIQSSSTDAVVENIKVAFNLNNLEAKMSLLMAADANAIEGVKLGSLLNFDDMISCALSIFHELSMSGFTASVGDIQQPSLSGFESVGIEDITATVIDGAFEMYKDSILLAMSSYFETTIRDSITDQLAELTSNAACPAPTMIDGDEFIDFRDLLLLPEESLLLNGIGDGRYGDSTILLVELVRNSTMADADGLSQLNSNVIRPMIAFHSPNGGGDIVFDSENSAPIKIDDQIELKLSDVAIQNVDTVMAPVDILQPSENPYSITNGIAFGPIQERPLNITTRLSFNITEGGFFLPTESDVDLSVSADSLKVSTVLFAMANTTTLKNFPVGDTENVHCWLNTFHEDGLYIDHALLEAVNFTVSLKCQNCTGPGAKLFLDLDDTSGFGLGSLIDSTELLNMFGATLMSDAFKEFMNGLLIAAPELCPHSERYNNETVTDYNTAQDIFEAMIQNMIIKPFEDFYTLFTAFPVR